MSASTLTRPKTVIVGYAATESSLDALTLGFLLAERPGWRLLLANAYAVPALAREDAEQLLLRGLRALPYGQPATTRAVEGGSPAAVLSELAWEEEAQLVVVGSGVRRPGDVAQRLASDGPCPVAVAPPGFSTRAAAENP